MPDSEEMKTIRPQSLFFMPGNVGTRHSDAAHDVGLEKTSPVGIGDFFKSLGLEYPEIVDENVRLRHAPDEFINAGSSRKIGRDSVHLRRWKFLQQRLTCRLHLRVGSAIEHDRGTGCGQALRDRKSDTRGGAGDNRALAAQIDVHDVRPVW